VKRNPNKVPSLKARSRLHVSAAELFQLYKQVRGRGGGGLDEVIEILDERRHDLDRPVRQLGESRRAFVRRTRQYFQKEAVSKRRRRTRREITLTRRHLQTAWQIHSRNRSLTKQAVARRVEERFKRDGLPVSYRQVEIEIDRIGGLESLALEILAQRSLAEEILDSAK
jgi:hypothetical protein